MPQGRIRDFPGVQVTLKKDFLQSFPMQYFSRQGNSLIHDSQQVNVFGSSQLFPEAYDGCFKVKTLDDLNVLEQQIFSRPSFFECSILLEERAIHYKHKQRYNYIMFINFKQPIIKEQLQQVIRAARKYLTKGKRFSATMDFGFILRSWFNLKYSGTHEMLVGGTLTPSGTQVVVTNFSKSMFGYMDNPMANVAVVLCGLCILPVLPFYCCYRKLACKDMRFVMTAFPKVSIPAQTSTPRPPVQRDDTFNGLFSDQEIRSRFSGKKYQPPKPLEENKKNLQLVEI